MIIQYIECPFGDQVSLSNTKRKLKLRYYYDNELAEMRKLLAEMVNLGFMLYYVSLQTLIPFWQREIMPMS